jgi:uncharacterized membrane protein YkoI
MIFRSKLAITGLSVAAAAGGTFAADASAGAGNGLTRAQARQAQSAALARVPGRAVDIDRNASGTFEVEVLTRSGATRDVKLSRSFRVTRVRNDDSDDGLTYASAGQAKRAALARVAGTVVEVERENSGATRYKVDVLRANGSAVEVRLSNAFAVLSTGPAGTDDNGGDDDGGSDDNGGGGSDDGPNHT